MSPPRVARPHQALAALALAALAAGCANATWWERDLAEWEGASVSELMEAWGPPLRTVTSEAGGPVLVYERSRQLDTRIEQLADPGARLDPGRSMPAYSAPQRSDCTLFFEIRDEVVAATRHEGGACDVLPRDPARRRSDPPSGRQR
jgi:hypothetical protein